MKQRGIRQQLFLHEAPRELESKMAAATLEYEAIDASSNVQPLVGTSFQRLLYFSII